MYIYIYLLFIIIIIIILFIFIIFILGHNFFLKLKVFLKLRSRILSADKYLRIFSR